METKYTPGPWECFYKHKYDEWHVSVPMAQGAMKWALFDDGVRSENPEADARLIAAAPDLAEALQPIAAAYPNDPGTADLYDEQPVTITLGDVRRAWAALRKAGIQA